MLRSDPAQAAKTRRQRKCLHEHWKNCHDYPEAHTWESRAEEDIEEEEAVRALVAAEDDSYLAHDEACKVRQGRLSRSDIVSPSDNVKTRRCMHEHWKDCQDYPEAHKWVGKDPEYDEEEQVRALVWSQGTDEEDYIGEGEALRIAQLVSGMLVHAEPSSAGTSTAGRMKTT
ncbi:hypothetical protein EI94DRAFT_1809544 [Lactarius quietus]|nr:hypothetical protein EI94DRAFT_1809544 [Lactarius quietus]